MDKILRENQCLWHLLSLYAGVGFSTLFPVQAPHFGSSCFYARLHRGRTDGRGIIQKEERKREREGGWPPFRPPTNFSIAYTPNFREKKENLRRRRFQKLIHFPPCHESFPSLLLPLLLYHTQLTISPLSPIGCEKGKEKERFPPPPPSPRGSVTTNRLLNNSLLWESDVCVSVPLTGRSLMVIASERRGRRSIYPFISHIGSW